jgi:hypothetical protein
MPSTLRGLGSWLVTVAVPAGRGLLPHSPLPTVSAQTVSPGDFDFVVMGHTPYSTKEV